MVPITDGETILRSENREISILLAREEVTITQGLRVMELAGLEPATSWVRSRRSPN